MKRFSVLLIACILFCAWSLAGAQELSQVPIPSVYNVEMGRHIYYMPTNTLEVKGYDFSSKRSWSYDSYASWKLPFVTFTYTNSPSGLSTADGAMLFSGSHRGDAEFKLGQVINPTITVEWSSLELHTWKMGEAEKVSTGEDGKEITTKIPIMVHNRDVIQRLYGGAGLVFETPVAYALTFKAAGSYRFLNQRGWEGSAGLCWTPGKWIKGEPHILIGVTGQECYYDWGKSRNLGVMAEVGLTF